MSGANVDAEMTALDESLCRRFRVVESDVRIAGRDLRILHPESAEELIDESDFERDERLPYWAELWPSAQVLAAQMLALRGNGQTMLELGCGAGLVSVCAALAGFDVAPSDYYEDAVRFARLNAWRNRTRTREGIMLDWRHLPEDIERFDVVIASDVLYERPYGEIVARTIAATMRENGRAVVADPGRVGRESFLDALSANGLALRSYNDIPYADGSIRQTIRLLDVIRTY